MVDRAPNRNSGENYPTDRTYRRPNVKKFEKKFWPVTNFTHMVTDGSNNQRKEPMNTVMCQYNPLHVVSETHIQNHERYDCPDRGWIPGTRVAKYSDFEHKH
uniref:Uncharacterized protein n=1 Tax=Caenorhabditis japonica TaxID=281687 RepID=A0A8R1EU55_CAEJA